MKILKLIESKISSKYLLYLKENQFELYKSLNKDESNVPNELINNKVFEVLEVSNLNDEELYLIGTDDNELGWVSVTQPILMLNSFLEQVTPLETIEDSSLNVALGISEKVSPGQTYISKYICRYNEELYIGLESNESFTGFYPINKLDFGKVQKISFKFNNSIVNVYMTEELSNSQTVITDNQKYVVEKYFKNAGIGTVKIGKNEYWFKGKDTNIDDTQIKPIVKNYHEYYLEHLIQSIKLEKSVKSEGSKQNNGVNKEYVESLQKRTNNLKEKNIEHLEKNRELLKLNKKLNKNHKEDKLELRRKDSKIDYFERLINNQDNKLVYYQDRTKKLEDRVQLLEEKLKNTNQKYKELKNSKLIRIQSKFFGK